MMIMPTITSRTASSLHVLMEPQSGSSNFTYFTPAPARDNNKNDDNDGYYYYNIEEEEEVDGDDATIDIIRNLSNQIQDLHNEISILKSSSSKPATMDYSFVAGKREYNTVLRPWYAAGIASSSVEEEEDIQSNNNNNEESNKILRIELEKVRDELKYTKMELIKINKKYESLQQIREMELLAIQEQLYNERIQHQNEINRMKIEIQSIKDETKLLIRQIKQNTRIQLEKETIAFQKRIQHAESILHNLKQILYNTEKQIEIKNDQIILLQYQIKMKKNKNKNNKKNIFKIKLWGGIIKKRCVLNNNNNNKKSSYNNNNNKNLSSTLSSTTTTTTKHTFV